MSSGEESPTSKAGPKLVSREADAEGAAHEQVLARRVHGGTHLDRIHVRPTLELLSRELDQRSPVGVHDARLRQGAASAAGERAGNLTSSSRGAEDPGPVGRLLVRCSFEGPVEVREELRLSGAPEYRVGADHVLGMAPRALFTGAPPARCVHDGLHRLVGRARRSLGSQQAGLPAIEVGLVPQTEEEHRAYGRIAGEVGDEAGVDLGLGGLARRLDRLLAEVVALQPGEDPDLPADLVEPEPKSACAATLREGRLRRAAERVPERLLDPVEIRDTGVRPAVPAHQWVAVPLGVGMEAELVHDRPLALAD